MATINAAEKLASKLSQIIKGTEGLPRVSIGFLRDATYPDGTSVAMVAAINEFGKENQPSRPFFRLMVAEKRDSWSGAMALNMKDTGFDADKTLDRMGQGIKGQLQTSIRDLLDPPLAPSTVAKKGFSKPLIGRGHMMNSVDYRVEKD